MPRKSNTCKVGEGDVKEGDDPEQYSSRTRYYPRRPFVRIPRKKKRVRHLFQLSFISISAERGGFEPPKPFRGLHAFQACQFSHSCTFPDAGTNIEIIFVSSRIFLSIFNWKSKTIFLTGRINSTISPEGTWDETVKLRRLLALGEREFPVSQLGKSECRLLLVSVRLLR